MRYVGLDIHLRSCSICILDEDGKEIQARTVRGNWRSVVEVLEEVEQPFAVCFEAGLEYGCLYDALKGLASSVQVAHLGHLRLIFRSKRKNDRVDAQKLAKLLYLDEVPTIHVPSEEVRNWRGLIEHRVRLVEKRTRVKNSLRALLRASGVGGRSHLWSQKGQAWLREVELPTPLLALRRDMLLDELSHFDQQIGYIEKQLDAIAKDHSGIALLRTIPAVGPRTAEAVLAYIDDPHRFSHTKSIGSYFGLVPRQDASGSFNRLGHITRDGPITVRRMLTEVAWQGLRRSPRIREYFQRIQQGDRQRTKIALVATAHYLARVMLAMLKTGEVWREEPLQQAA